VTDGVRAGPDRGTAHGGERGTRGPGILSANAVLQFASGRDARVTLGIGFLRRNP